MAAAVAIHIVPMTKPTGLALTMGNQLGPTKLDVGGKALRSRFKFE